MQQLKPDHHRPFPPIKPPPDSFFVCFHVGLKPAALQQQSEGWSCTAQLIPVQLCLAGSHTILDYSCLHCTLPRGEEKSSADLHLSPVQHLCRHVTVLLFFHIPPRLSLWGWEGWHLWSSRYCQGASLVYVCVHFVCIWIASVKRNMKNSE